jgi:hypothetical protein
MVVISSLAIFQVSLRRSPSSSSYGDKQDLVKALRAPSATRLASLVYRDM